MQSQLRMLVSSSSIRTNKESQKITLGNRLNQQQRAPTSGGIRYTNQTLEAH